MTAFKKLVLRIVMLSFWGAFSLILSAQEIDIGNNDDKPIEERLVYNHQNSINIDIHSQGLGMGFKLGKIKSIYKTVNWEAQLVSLHSLKEIKTINVNTSYTRPFVYGKLNNVFVLRFGYGQERRIFGKPYWGGIETLWTYEAGASLALLKPYYYYVVIYKSTGDGYYQEIVDEQTFDDSDQWMEIVGKSAFTKGLKETKLSPGLHASTGLSFEIGKSRTRVQAIDIKVIAETFPLGVSIMDSQRDKRFFLTFQLSYSWGSRFNKY